MAVEKLEPAVEGLAQTREALHRVAEELVAPARKPQNEIALKATPGGFGTPLFEFGGAECQVRVEGADLVVKRAGEERREPLSTLAAGARLIGEDLLPDGPPTNETPLGIDPAAAEQLGRWYGLAGAALEALREEWAADDASESNLWPEHFDIAIEAGSAARGSRANYGFSPGDAEHKLPYLYVGPWTAEVSGDIWNAKGFNGAELDYSEIVGAEDQLAFVLDFCRTRKELLDRLEEM